MAKIYAGFQISSIGTATIGWTDSGGTHTASITTGTFAHVDMQSFMGSGNYDDFATTLQAAMDAVAGSPLTFDISYNASSQAYTIEGYNPHPTPANFLLTTSTNAVMRNILGYQSLPTSNAASTSSQIAPYYVIDTEVDGQSSVTDDYEPDGLAFDGEMDDGTSTGVSRTSAPTYFDWVQMMEPKASTFIRNAATAVPWTYQHLWQHTRNVEPIYYVPDVAPTPTTAACFKLRADGAPWKPQRVTADYDGQWNIPFRCRLVGR